MADYLSDILIILSHVQVSVAKFISNSFSSKLNDVYFIVFATLDQLMMTNTYSESLEES